MKGRGVHPRVTWGESNWGHVRQGQDAAQLININGHQWTPLKTLSLLQPHPRMAGLANPLFHLPGGGLAWGHDWPISQLSGYMTASVNEVFLLLLESIGALKQDRFDFWVQLCLE